MGRRDRTERERPPRRPRRSLVRRIAWIFAGLLALLLAVVGVLAVTTPWAPDIEVVDPAATGRRVTDQGLLGNYYPASEASATSTGPAVLVLGGSEGGLGATVDREARVLQQEGFSALALAYWGGPDQPERMEHLPLETFDTALDWLAARPEVDPQRVGILGGSKGAEAALLVSTRRPVAAVVATMPSSVAWAGIDLAEIWRMANIGSTWSEGGQPVPHLPYARAGGGDTFEVYVQSLDQVSAHPESVIPIERSTAPTLLVAGEADSLWPSARMAREVQQRAETSNGPDVTVLTYPDAGHLAQGPPPPEPMEELTALGGTASGNHAAMADAWQATVAFLREHLA